MTLKIYYTVLTILLTTGYSHAQKGWFVGFGGHYNFIRVNDGAGMKSLNLGGTFVGDNAITRIEAGNSWGVQASCGYNWSKNFIEITTDYRFRRFSITNSTWSPGTEKWTLRDEPDLSFWLNSRHTPIIYNFRVREYIENVGSLYFGLGFGHYLSELNSARRQLPMVVSDNQEDYSLSLVGNFWSDYYSRFGGDLTVNIQLMTLKEMKNGAKVGVKLLLSKIPWQEEFNDGIRFHLSARSTRGNEADTHKTFWLQQNAFTLMVFYRPARFTLNASKD